MAKYIKTVWANGGTPAINATNLTKIETGIYDTQTETRSATQTTQQGVASVPTGTFNGQCEGSIGGQSLVNSVVNPDFAGGTTGWSANGCTQSVSNGINSIVGNGASQSPYVYQNLDIVYQANKYLKGGNRRIRVTNSVCQSLRIEIYNYTDTVRLGILIVYTPEINRWYDLSEKIALSGGTAGQKIKILIMHVYADSATANGKVMEIDGNSGVHAIDLGTSASDPNYNKTNAELNNMIGGVLQNGINNVSGLSVVSTGKNLFDVNKPSYLGTRGYVLENFIRSYANLAYTGGSEFQFTLKPNTEYTYSYIAGLGGNAVQTYGYLINGSVILYDASYGGVITRTFTTSSSGIITMGFGRFGGGNDLNGWVDVTNIQLEEGTISTTYEPYISSTLTPNKVLRSVPNQIKDREYWANGECYFEQNVKALILASGDITAYATTNTNNDVITITKPTDSSIYNVATQSLANSQTFDFPNFMAISAITDATTSIGMLCNVSTTTIQIAVANTTYADLAAARTALAGTIINYQLATPITTKLDLSFRCYENGSFACSGSVLNPVIAVTTPTTIAGSVNDNIRGLTQVMRILSEQFQFLNEKNQTFDTNNIVTDYRLTNQAGVLLYKAVLSGGTTPSYTTLTETYYDNAGNLQYTVTSTLTWVSAYKLDSKVVSSIV